MHWTRERSAGLLWLLAIVPSWFAFGYVRGMLVVSGDDAATAALIETHQLLWREGIAALWLTNLLMMLFAITLYPSLKDSDKDLSRIFLVSMIISVTVSLVTSVLQWGALAVYAPGLEGSLGGFAHPLSAMFARIANSGLAVAELLWTPFYASFGLILVKSRRAPWPIGLALIAMGLGYSLNSFTKLLIPTIQPALFTQIAMSLGALGGLPTIVWLVWRGLAPIDQSARIRRPA